MTRKRTAAVMRQQQQSQVERSAILRAVWPLPGAARRPDAQVALVYALIDAMGALSGEQPDMRAIAEQLGVGRQQVYRMLRVLEAKGVVVRLLQRGLEIRL